MLRQYKLRKVSPVLLHGPGSARKRLQRKAKVGADRKSNMINCRFCGTSNAREENRCFRCGRRLHLANARAAPESYRPGESTVHAAPAGYRTGDAEPVSAPPELHVADLHRSLGIGVSDGGGRGAATRMAPSPVVLPATVVSTAAADREFPMGGLPGEGEWGSLSFQQAKERVRAPESEIYSDDQVAPLPARIMAGVFDGFVMLGAFGLMALAYAAMTWNLGADPIPASAVGWAIYGVLMLAVIVFYRSLFILAGADSPGMRWAGLRLVTFDGEEPTPPDRFMRVAWGVFSVLPLGLGLLWALVDQERLTWHDLLSKTFPSPDTTSNSVPRWSR